MRKVLCGQSGLEVDERAEDEAGGRGARTSPDIERRIAAERLRVGMLPVTRPIRVETI